jgi:hypothetical protein
MKGRKKMIKVEVTARIMLQHDDCEWSAVGKKEKREAILGDVEIEVAEGAIEGIMRATEELEEVIKKAIEEAAAENA